MKTTRLSTHAPALNDSACVQDATVSAIPRFNIFELGIRQGQHTAYDNVAEHNMCASLGSESGTLAMYSLKQKTHPDIAWMIEIYADNDAYQLHLDSAPYQAFLRASPDIIADHHKRNIHVMPQFLGDKKIEQDEATISNLVIVEVKPEFAQAFRAVVIPEMIQSLRVEEGVLAMYAVTEQDNPARWYFCEIYSSEDAYQAHRNTAHFKDYLQQTAEMTTYKQAVQVVPVRLMNKGGLSFTAN